MLSCCLLTTMFKPQKSTSLLNVTVRFICSHVAVTSGRESESEVGNPKRLVKVNKTGQITFLSAVRKPTAHIEVVCPCL